MKKSNSKSQSAVSYKIERRNQRRRAHAAKRGLSMPKKWQDFQTALYA